LREGIANSQFILLVVTLNHHTENIFLEVSSLLHIIKTFNTHMDSAAMVIENPVMYGGHWPSLPSLPTCMLENVEVPRLDGLSQANDTFKTPEKLKLGPLFSPQHIPSLHNPKREALIKLEAL
jgi:hypothetical protein